jgi:diguanylate cyclase
MNMNLIGVDILYGCYMAIMGATVAWLLCWTYFRSKPIVQSGDDACHAGEVLLHLQELTIRVAVDIDEHSTQVEEINDELTSIERHDDTKIVNVVAKLIQANQHMQKKLATTEDKLREQSQEIQTLTAEAHTDALTMLANRRVFDNELDRRIAEYSRHGRTFSLIMADVDHFKKFNNTYGHQAGDEVLRGVAKLLRRKMREMDLVARYGGEEFAVILPGTNHSDACRATLRACEAIEKSHFHYDGKELQVTVSFGVAEAKGSRDGAALVARADTALYAAKENGRHCAYWHDGEAVHRIALNKQPALPEAVNQRQSSPTPGEPENDKKPDPAPDTKITEPKPELARALALDVLAGLPSRTTFCQQIRNRTAEWKRGGPIFSIALIEVNQFDERDGHHGQRSREVATVAATEFLAATVREMDIVGYYAPGCFALLLPTAGLVDAIRAAERLREGFCQLNFSTQGEQQRLTWSVGVVQVMENDDAISVLQRAEAALNAADRRGGNRVCYHDGERCVPITAMLETIEYLT